VTPLSRAFFADLAPLPSFADSVNIFKHTELPDDWWVVVADVADSTKAIAAGRYKEVNTIGASTIIAIVNVDRATAIPYVFGGDGVSCAVPPEMESGCRSALLAAVELARTAFGMTLRVGMIPVGALRAGGDWVRVAKIRAAGDVYQTLLSGRGWEAAERRLKAGSPELAVARPGIEPVASFEGLECRWQAVKSQGGCKLSIVAVALAPDPEAQMATYGAILDKIHALYGDVESFHPLKAEALKLTLSLQSLRREIAVRTQGQGAARRALYAAALLVKLAIGVLLFRFRIDTRQVKWGRYRAEVVQNTDYRKFDGALKMVIESTVAQRAELEAYLEEEYRRGRLVYGTHASRAAILTCLVHSYDGRHSHFVDGSDGGYVVAAKHLKDRLKERAQAARA
jgi:hypothetical protein